MPVPTSSHFTMPKSNQKHNITTYVRPSRFHSRNQFFPSAHHHIIMTHQHKVRKTWRGTYPADPSGINIKQNLEPRRLLVDTLKKEVPGFDLCLSFQCFEWVKRTLLRQFFELCYEGSLFGPHASRRVRNVDETLVVVKVGDV